MTTPPPKPRGRPPTKLTDAVRDTIAARLAEGALVRVACADAGVSKDAFCEWMRRGLREPDGIHGAFRAAVSTARARYEQTLIARIRLAGDLDWRAAAWELERRFPGRWAARQRLEHTGKNGGPITVNDARAALAAAVARVAAEPDPDPTGGAAGEPSG